MLSLHDPDDYVTETKSHTCEFHKRTPWEQSAGCTCSFSMGQRRATPEEKQENIRRRLAEEERRRQHMADYDAGRIK
jgi:hypothetical protein